MPTERPRGSGPETEQPPPSDRQGTLRQAADRSTAAWSGSASARLRLRRWVYEVIEVGRGEHYASQTFDAFLITLIILNIVAFTLETVPSIEAQYAGWLHAFDMTSLAIFTVEYLLRLWTAVEVPFLSKLPPFQARLKFATRPHLIIDFLAIAPFFLAFLFSVDLRLLRVFRLFRLFKLARYSPAMHTLMRVLINERRSLMGAVLLMLVALLFAATGIYHLERHVQPDKFGSIPDAAWWGMATLTTVGYGDTVPITPLGKMFGAVIMVVGLGMFALPIAIIATGFAQEVSKRDFVVTWSLMSRIPLFTDLDANEIAELMRYVAAHNFPPHWEVIRAGTPGDAMYFIASGRVRVKTSGGEAELATGDFFGEIAMLDGSAHEYGFTTTSHARLLKIHRDDFHRLSHANPRIGEQIRTVAQARQIARARGLAEPTSRTEDLEARLR